MRCFMACYCSVAMQTAEQTHYILVRLHWKHFSSSYWSTDCVALFFLCSHSFDFDMWRRRRAEWNQFVLSETCYSAADVCQMLSKRKKRTESVGLYDCWQKHYMYISTCICLDIRGKLHYNYFMIRDYYCTVKIQMKKDPIKMFSG